MDKFSRLKKICRLIRYDILTSTSAAESGHATSALSAVELLATLFFTDFYRYDLDHPENPHNDRFILSKGHASPLLYSLYQAAGVLNHRELLTLRKFDSNLEGHPTPHFKYVDVATGSLGQGLSAGIGMALGINLKFKILNLKLAQKPKVFVLMGDSEMSEGQVWEAMQIASYYKLNNLVAVIDVNRLGQRGETMLGWDVETYAKRAQAFGWEPVIIDDGHDLNKIYNAFSIVTGVEMEGSPDDAQRGPIPQRASAGGKSRQAPSQSKPKIIIAKTVKGKGISFLENKNGWHGKPVPKNQLDAAIKELGELDFKIKGKILPPNYQPAAKSEIANLKSLIQQLKDNRNNLPLTTYNLKPTTYNLRPTTFNLQPTLYNRGNLISTREAYGDALVALGEKEKNLLVLDAELSNSTFADKFAKRFPARYFEMFIAEQNMVSTSTGLEKMGFKVFNSTFGAFFTRAFDQIRMTQYSRINLRLVGSHTGVFLGKDGPSQMALEDFSMFRSLLKSTVLCGADAVSTFKLVGQMLSNNGIIYLRTMRDKLPIIYSLKEEFEIGGSKILLKSSRDRAVIFAAGVTVHEALKACAELKKEQISVALIDLYSIKPLDIKTVQSFAKKCQNILVVEDHYPFGGLGEAVLSALTNLKFKIPNFKFSHLCVQRLPRSGTPEDLLSYEGIDSQSIIKKVKELI